MSKRRKRRTNSPTTIRLSDSAQQIVDETSSRTGFTPSRVINLMIELARDALHDGKARLPLWRKYVAELEAQKSTVDKTDAKVKETTARVNAAAKLLRGPGARSVTAAQLDADARASERGAVS